MNYFLLKCSKCGADVERVSVTTYVTCYECKKKAAKDYHAVRAALEAFGKPKQLKKRKIVKSHKVKKSKDSQRYSRFTNIDPNIKTFFPTTNEKRQVFNTTRG